MALAVPDAYRDEGAWFAVAYFVVRVLNSTLFSWGVRNDPGQLRATFRLGPWFLAAALVALAGGFVGSDLRAWVWLLSLAIDVVGTLTVARADWRVSPSHFAERFALIVIIALGESIVAIGVATSHLERDATFALSVVVAFAGVAALWWSYFDFTALAAERSLRRASAACSRLDRPRRLHVLPLPDRARDHPLRRRGEDDPRGARSNRSPARVAGRSVSGSRCSCSASRSHGSG